MEAIKEYIEKNPARLLTEIRDDESRKNDIIIGQFMKGRLAVEEHYLKTLDEITEMLKNELFN